MINTSLTILLVKKTVKWWKYLFWHLIDNCIINAWIIARNNGQEKEYPEQLKFRISVAEKLIGNFTSRERANNTTSIMPQTLHVQHYTGKCDTRKDCVVCSTPEKRVQVRFYCKQCNKPMCDIPCFENFHTK